MAHGLILSGTVLLSLCLLGFGPVIGYRLQRNRMRSNSVFVAEHQNQALVDALSTDTGELHLPEIGEELDPERYFLENPLFSLTLPRELDQRLPIADSVFDDLAAAKLLTGVGVNVDGDWEAWNLELQLMVKELVPA